MKTESFESFVEVGGDLRGRKEDSFDVGEGCGAGVERRSSDGGGSWKEERRRGKRRGTRQVGSE